MIDSYQVLDFMIVGAAKSGTTSLHNYLNEYNDIFMSVPKEPKFISSHFVDLNFSGINNDYVADNVVTSLEEYKNLFSDATRFQVRGESSADNLYFHDQSIPLIKEYFGDVKIIIILRNPIDRAFSAYKHMRREVRDDLSFYDSLLREEEKVRSNYDFVEHYLSVGLYSKAVESFMNAFSDVKIMIYEDFIQDIHKSVLDTRKFLGLEQVESKSSYHVYNVSGEPRLRRLKRLIRRYRKLSNCMKVVLPARIVGILREIINEVKEIPMGKKEIEFLSNYYREDVKRLENVLDTDLNVWRRKYEKL